MARVYEINGDEIWEICSPDGELRMSFLPKQGGLGISLEYLFQERYQELLWLHPDFWKMPAEQRYGGFPFLFPICGRQEKDGQEGRYSWHSVDYYLPIHGFAPRIPWEVVRSDSQTLVMQLTQTPATQKVFPFCFKVELTYLLEGNELICRQSYTNTGETTLPYIAGFHPYFNVPAQEVLRKQCSFDCKPESRFIYNAKMTDIIGTAIPLKFPASITNPDINESLHRVYGNHNVSKLTSDRIQIELKAYSENIEHMFPYIQLFTQNEFSFFCVEPWMGTPNGLNREGEHRLLAPGKTEKALFCIRICNR